MSKNKRTIELVDPAEGISSALVICAHPDDVDFGAAGTVARMTQGGVKVTYCLVTSGDAGGSDRTTSNVQRAALRESEQTQAARCVGVEDLVFLRHADGTVQANLGLRRDLSRVIRQVRPDRVITQSPVRNLDRIYASHPDHLAAGEAAMAAVYPDARNPFAFTELLDEGLEPHTVPEIWLMGSAEMTVAVEITDTFDDKIAALHCHDSQLADPGATRGFVREWNRSLAKAVGLKKPRLAEGFRRVETR